MKSTLADNKQLFRVDAVETAGSTADTIAPNTIGIIDMSTGLTVVPGSFTALPDEFRIVSKLNGQIYYSFDTIKKANIKNATHQDYTAPVAEIWETTIDCCSCIEDMQLNVNLTVPELTQEVGLTWTTRDFQYVVATAEMKCHCSCDGTAPVYENNIMTKLMAEQVNSETEAFYTASIQYTAASTITTTPSSTPKDFYLTGSVLYLVDASGTGVIVGKKVGTSTTVMEITDVDAFIEAFKDDNLAGVPGNYGPMLKLVLTGVNQTTPNYYNLEENYVYPRGVAMNPSMMSPKGGCVNTFTKTQDLVFELGAGYDLRAEEFDNMSYYTNLNHRPQNSSGIASKDLIYQFENAKNYDVVNFEFFTDKTERNNGDKRLFGVLFGTTDSTVYGKLKAMFGA